MLPLENPKVTSEYGIIRSDKKLHKGIDLISMSGDRNVKAIRSGVVRVTPYDKDGFGNYISMQQKDGFRALYCHLEKILVKPGDTIEEGQVIGVEGTSGNSTGVHLHLELRKAPYDIGDHINVAEYLKIKNQKGKVEYIGSEDGTMTREDYEKIIKDKSGIDDNSIKYLELYRYGDDLIRKLAEAMK